MLPSVGVDTDKVIGITIGIFIGIGIIIIFIA